MVPLYLIFIVGIIVVIPLALGSFARRAKRTGAEQRNAARDQRADKENEHNRLVDDCQVVALKELKEPGKGCCADQEKQPCESR